MSETTLIRGGHLLTQDADEADGIADILVEGGRISAIWRGGSTPDVDAAVIEAEGMLLVPGFVDTHRHTWQTALRGLGPTWAYEDYRTHVQIRYGQVYEPEDVYVGNLAGDLGALAAGVTTVCDESHIQNSPEHTDAAVAAHWDSGIRSVFDYGWPSTDAEEWQFGSERTHPEDIRRVRSELLPDDTARVTLAAMLRGPELSTLPVTVQDLALARELGLRSAMHVGNGAWGEHIHGIRQLREAGLLGPDLVFIHCCTADADELQAVADTGGSVSLSAALETFMPGLGQPATNRALAAGLLPSFSVDTETIVAGDMFGVMRAALAWQQLQRATVADFEERLPIFSAADALRFGTLGGATAAGLGGRTGSITVGKQADLLLCALDAPSILPGTDSANLLVAHGHPGVVDTVLVAGVVVKRGGRLVDETRYADTVQRLAASRDRILAA